MRRGREPFFLPQWRNLVCGLLIVLVPAALLGQDSRAILHANGGALLNGSPAANSTALFPHDVVQTQTGAPATIDAEGSSVTVDPETLLQFEGDELALDHGHLQVSTSRSLKVRVNCMTITPRTAELTRYQVTDADGKLQLKAEQNDVQIQLRGSSKQGSKAGLSETTVHAGEQVTRDDNCAARPKTGDIVDAKTPILNSTEAKIIGGAAIIAITCYALCQSGNPISPAKP